MGFFEHNFDKLIVDQPHTAGQFKQRDIGKSILIVLFVILVCYLLIGRPGVPESFYGDSTRIQLIAQERVSAEADPSYQNVGDLYRYLGLSSSPSIAALLGLFSFGFLIFLTPRVDSVRYGPITYILFASSLVLATVFLGSYSKDFIVCFVLAPLVTFLHKPKASLFWFCILAICYGLLFRSYWLIVVVLFLYFRYALTRESWFKFSILSLLTSFVTLSLAFRMVLGIPADFYRTRANDSRVGGYFEAESAIHSPFSSDNIVFDSLNLLFTFLSFVFPIQIVSQGIIYIAFSAFLSLIWIRFYRSLWNVRHDKLPTVAVHATAFILAFTTVQTLFEPDYGSYIRHLTPALPLIIVIPTILIEKHERIK